MEAEQLLTCALDIGEQMLISGAEIGRVEDSVRHICTAYGCSRTDVFTITSSIVVSIEDADRKYYTFGENKTEAAAGAYWDKVKNQK